MSLLPVKAYKNNGSCYDLPMIHTIVCQVAFCLVRRVPKSPEVCMFVISKKMPNNVVPQSSIVSIVLVDHHNGYK